MCIDIYAGSALPFEGGAFATLKYYTYVSRAKVDMLLPQVPLVFKTKFAAEVGVNIGIFITKVSSETVRSFDDSDVRRLELVSRYIESSDEVGDLKSSKKWIKVACTRFG